MSGHSKWATTKHKKAIIDAKRSASFTKLANVVTIAARNGGDPTMNFQLRLAIDRAKAASMPKENIDRAIKRGTGEIGGAAIEEIIYEGYGPGGVAILIECLTDNRQRTVGNVRAAFSKSGGSLAEAGSVAYLFEKKGQLIVNQSENLLLSSSGGKARSGDPLIVDSRLRGNDNQELEEIIIDSGADDFQAEDENIIIYTSVSDLQSVAKFLTDAGVKISSSELTYLPKTLASIPEEKLVQLEKLLDLLDADDDVSNIFTNVG